MGHEGRRTLKHVWHEKSSSENLKVIEILKASKNNLNTSEALRLICTYLVRICCWRSTSCFDFGFVIQAISEKNFVATVLLAMREIFVYGNNCKYDSYKSGYKFAFIPFLSLLRNQKQKSDFQGVGKKYFCFLFKVSYVLLQSHAEFNRLL